MTSEFQFLKDNPHFEERPASILEFMGDGYMNCYEGIRPAIRDSLVDIFGTEPNPTRIALFEEGIITGAIGIGKTTIASIVLPYFTHWTLCLRNPQEYYGLLPGTKIAFMQMSTSGTQAKQVIFNDVKARIDYCKWFKRFPYDPKFKNQLRFKKQTPIGFEEIWILPGDSTETTFEGYNILAGILDEADSHQMTKDKDYAEVGFSTIESRIRSRFEGRGMILVIGQMKRSTGFAAKKYAEYKKKDTAYSQHLAIWESFGWPRYTKPDGSRDSFFFDTKRFTIVPRAAATFGGNEFVIEIPTEFKPSFETNPMKALRDLAGIPPAAGSPFIPLVDRIERAQEKYIDSYGLGSPVNWKNEIDPAFRARDRLRRALHIDIAYSPNGDSLGMAMGHVRGLVKPDGEDEEKPYIVIDAVWRIHAPPGREIFLGDIRRIIYHLKDDLKFNIVMATTDGFESTDTRQQLERRRIGVDVVSVDRNLTPYYDFRDALYEYRIEFPKHMVQYREYDTDFTNIILKEASELTEDTNKVDHPPEGSKDVTDSIAGVTYTLMGDRAYCRKGQSVSASPLTSVGVGAVNGRYDGMRLGGMGSPVPPRGVIPTWTPPPRR